MNITFDDLKKIHKIYINSKTTYISKECPPPKIILNFFRLKLSKKQKIKVIDHVSNCYSCSKEFEFISEIMRTEKTFLEGINLSPQNKISCFKKKYINSLFPIFKKPLEPFFYIAALKYSLVIVFLLSISIISVKFFNSAKKLEYRGINQEEITLINPVEKKESKSSLIFKWNIHKVPDYYKIEIFDNSLFLIWESRKLNNTYATLPNNVLKKLEEHCIYFWMVTAYYPNGIISESQLEKFTLIK